jgi:UDP-N-acetylenolpyruvoylglucosamine reductase
MDNNVQIDDALLEELGYAGLSTFERQKLQETMLETLQMRIGYRLSENLNDEQIATLETKFAFTAEDTPEQVAEKQQAVAKWLQETHPNYKEVVAEEFEKLKTEMREYAPTSSGSQTA